MRAGAIYRRLSREATVARVAQVALLIIEVAALLFFAQPWPVIHGFPIDDAWIHQVVARTFAATGTLGYAPGQFGAGATSYLWAALLSTNYRWIHADPVVFTLALNIALYLGTGAVLLAMALRDGLRERRVDSPRLAAAEAVFVVGLASIGGNTIWFAFSGMEATLVVFLSVSAIACATRRPSSGSSSALAMVGAAAAVAALALTRPETIALGPLLAWVCHRSGHPRRQTAALLGCWGAAVAVYLGANLIATGSALPATLGGRKWIWVGDSEGWGLRLWDFACTWVMRLRNYTPRHFVGRGALDLARPGGRRDRPARAGGATRPGLDGLVGGHSPGDVCRPLAGARPWGAVSAPAAADVPAPGRARINRSPRGDRGVGRAAGGSLVRVGGSRPRDGEPGPVDRSRPRRRPRLEPRPRQGGRAHPGDRARSRAAGGRAPRRGEGGELRHRRHRVLVAPAHPRHRRSLGPDHGELAPERNDLDVPARPARGLRGHSRGVRIHVSGIIELRISPPPRRQPRAQSSPGAGPGDSAFHLGSGHPRDGRERSASGALRDPLYRQSRARGRAADGELPRDRGQRGALERTRARRRVAWGSRAGRGGRARPAHARPRADRRRGAHAAGRVVDPRSDPGESTPTRPVGTSRRSAGG